VESEFSPKNIKFPSHTFCYTHRDVRWCALLVCDHPISFPVQLEEPRATGAYDTAPCMPRTLRPHPARRAQMNPTHARKRPERSVESLELDDASQEAHASPGCHLPSGHLTTNHEKS
jgi:hypothetical protein